MRSRSGRLFTSLALLVIVGLGVSFAPWSDSDLTVHEWGTFTTVAGTDGRAMDWLPLSGPTDLPCFVYHYQNNPLVKVGFVVGVAPVVQTPSAAQPQPVTQPLYGSS